MGGITHKKPPGRAQGHRERNLIALPGGRRPEPPPPPAGLLKASKDRWIGFWASQVAATIDLDSDLPRLERWIGATDEYDRVARVCRKSRLVKGSMGQPVLNPLFTYLAQLEQQIAKAETEFGMTPMARLRLGIALGEAARSLEELNRSLDDDADTDDGDDGPDPRQWAVESTARPAATHPRTSGVSLD